MEEDTTTIEKQFKIIAIISRPNEELMLTLLPIDKNPHIDTEPTFKTEEERVGWRMGISMFKGMMSLDPSAPRGYRMEGGQLELVQAFNIVISYRDYQNLGSPLINSILALSVKMQVKGGPTDVDC